jgi:hypothetical protein
MKIKSEHITEFMLNTAPVVGALAAVAAGLHPDPTYNAIWTGISTFLGLMRPNEKEAFVEEFNKVEISESTLNSIEFARALKAAIEAASNTASEEKIKKIARLLRNGSMTGLVEDFDAFKEYTKLIDEISPREFNILAIMKHNMEVRGAFGVLRPPITQEEEKKVAGLRKIADDVTVTTAAWDDIPKETMTTLEFNWRKAKAQIKKELDVSDDALESYMLRLTRTGCVVPVAIQMFEGVKTIYRVTPLYISLEDYITDIIS